MDRMALGESERQRTIRTPDQRLRVFVSSTLGELREERRAARDAIEKLHLAPVMFELGARPHPPRELYRAYLGQSHVFVGIYWQSYGWVAPGEQVSGLEDEYRLSLGLPALIYIREPAPEREERLSELLRSIQEDDRVSYKRFGSPRELSELLETDLAVMLAERFEATVEVRRTGMSGAPPVPLTETVGREAEITSVLNLLESEVRLITLTGPGGVGKSRLALEVARRATEAYPGGIHFVSLAAVTEPELVLPTVANRVSAHAEGEFSAEAALVEGLAGARTLLLLDNLEQVAEVAPDLSSLLEKCPELQILATSRRALRTRGEREIAVAPLPLPDPGRGPSGLAQEPAVKLFVDRALAASGQLELNDANAAAVAELCRRLDGLPLAIELAAARTRLLTPPVLLARLGDHLDALGVGGADLPERQRTLRATVEWSYGLLTEPERELFERLSVFAGSFTLTAAEAVCDADGLDVMEGLAGLMESSLLLAAGEPEAEQPRFSMLETVRRYAREHLAKSGGFEAVRRRHLGWYLALAEEAQPYLCGPGQREWAARFDPERANVRAAVETAFDLGDQEAVIELTWDVIVFYFIRDAVHEPAAWLERVAAEGRALGEVQAAKLGSLLALLRIQRGEFEGAGGALESALSVFPRLGMDFEAAVTLKELAWVRYLLDEDAEAATTALEEAARLFDGLEHHWGVALTNLQLGSVLLGVGDLDAAQERFGASLERSRLIDNEPLVGEGLEHLAMALTLKGEVERALPLLEEAAELARRGRYITGATLCLDALAAVALARDDSLAAARALCTAAATRRRLGISPWPSMESALSELDRRARERLGEDEYEAVAAELEDCDTFAELDGALGAVVD